MYAVRPTSRFRKDLKRVQKRGYNLELLTAIIKKLARGESLDDVQHHDHAPSGKLAGCRECHIAPDWLLVYEISAGELILYLTRTGTHSDLFG
jgi:mRNA interferase YafQ